MKPILFDTHTHFNFNAFKDDWEKVIERTLEKNIWFVNVGAEAKTSERAVNIALKYPKGVYAAAGLHPIHTYDDEICRNRALPCSNRTESCSYAEEFDKNFYAGLIKKSKKVIALGEIGLDYFHIKKFSYILNKKLKAKQAEVFIEQIKLAEKYKKPIIIHCRPDKDCDAYREILDILKDTRKMLLDPRFRGDDRRSKDNNSLSGIVHCFQANIKILEQFISYGFMIGYNGVITFTDQYDELVKATPLEKIVLETDAPWLAPLPYRGKRNESLYVAEVAKRIAELKNISYEEVADRTTENAMRIFKLI